MNVCITADRIHDGTRWLPEGACLEIHPDGRIAGIHQEGAAPLHTLRHEGIITPGFVNVHCHLELSHMTGMIPRGTGLVPFLRSVMELRQVSPAARDAARRDAFSQMLAAGVVAAGDIANTTDTLDLRASDRMHIHSFAECIGFSDHNAEQRLAQAKQVYEAFRGQPSGAYSLSQSIVPHAPYSVSGTLFRLIAANSSGDRPVSIHNQESAEEDLFFYKGGGAFPAFLQGMGIDTDKFSPPGTSSLRSYLEHFPRSVPFIAVHNTFTPRADIDFAESRMEHMFWCLCPKANLYIEGTLPDVYALRAAHAVLCIGTDSLASNDTLSVLAELQTLKLHFPELETEELLRWGTANGADALGLSHLAGRLEAGLKPGILLIRHDLSDLQVLYPA